ncbi:HAAS signaling domain-containing protein [uncultured Pseudoflavonifractor sp.]|uniref:HAAS signaling domain-containing protein n=1 Tax=uncultured Pseudoflavonifractor sp. TaxID=1221379 RepID=UPI0025FF1F2C|nr:DUF1700 domain-containing protein [uncultured Pseudoflavonifractor sp.]
MSEQEYLGQLSDYLTGRISNRQLESILKYYKEYFEEKGPDQAWRAEEELGTPDEAAARILGAMPRTGGRDLREPRRWTGGRIAAVIVLSPIWVPVLLTVVVGLLGIGVCVAAGGVACVGGGLFSMWCGFTQVFYSIPTMVFFCGLGFLAAAMGLLLFLGGAALCVLWYKGMAALVRRMFSGGVREGEAA